MDVFTKRKRSEVMSKIKSQNTKIELILCNALKSKGHKFIIHSKMEGKPDLLFQRKKIAIFVDGCFWHKCPECFRRPKSNKKYWTQKIEKNVNRDKIITANLKKRGYFVLRIWEHEIKKSLRQVLKKIETRLINRSLIP